MGVHLDGKLTSLARGAVIVLTIQMSGAGISYLLQVLLARWMGLTEYGTYDYVMAWGTFLAILAGFGFPTSVLRFLPHYIVNQDWARLRGLVLTSWPLTLGGGLVLSLLATVVLFLNPHRSFANTTPLLLGLWMVPLFALLRLQSEMLRAIGQVALAYTPLLVIWPLLVLGSAFLLTQVSHTLTSVPLLSATMIALLTILSIQFWFLWRSLPKAVYQARPHYEVSQWLRVSFPLLLINGFSIILGQTDVIMVGVLLGSKEVGIYSAAVKTTNWVSFILQAVNAVAAPMVASLYAQGKHRELQRVVSAVTHWIFWPALVISTGLMVFPKQILGLFGPEFIAAQWEMIILALGQLVNVGVGSVGVIMTMTGHQNQALRVFGWSALAHIILNLVGISLLGILGAAIATAVTMALWNIWLYTLVVKHLSIYPSIVSAFKS